MFSIPFPSQAKRTGEVVKQAREGIQHHKSLIEKIRRDVAMNYIGRLGDDKEEESHPAEMESGRAMEIDKKAYQQAFQQLKELKSEIEHIKRLVEKGRTKLQKAFDIWHDKMCNTTEIIDSNSSCIPDQRSMYSTSRELREESNSSTNRIPANAAVNRTVDNVKSTFKLQLGARLTTGNKETDDGIIAFYKAKEALSARSKARDAQT